MPTEEVLTALIVSRNKLIEDLLVELPETDSQFKKGLSMRDKSFAKDKDIWDKRKGVNDARPTTRTNQGGGNG